MSKKLLEIKELYVNADEKEILKKASLFNVENFNLFGLIISISPS